MTYGVPYKGSKNKIANWVVDHLPVGDVLVDIFVGGCAITHAAMLQNRFKRYVVNDINNAPDLFVNAIKGAYAHETQWIDRQTFLTKIDDPYVKYIWSFGNGGGQFLYSREVEPWKEALHNACLLGDLSLIHKFGIYPPLPFNCTWVQR